MKLTPLNIALASVLVWALGENMTGEKPLFSWYWLLLFALVLVLVDILFRMWFKNLKRLWIVQCVFLILVSIIVVLIKLQF
ncbi:hypothetical protein ACFRAE_15270 [Sphingobacterium sp. HJSM2_6]|uniref:hypothetical protein n=1 Tax=Sphingobacterium sp. HJSM2_6 TaxID=3366264 RepID=UPI003BDCC2DF